MTSVSSISSLFRSAVKTAVMRDPSQTSHRQWRHPQLTESSICMFRVRDDPYCRRQIRYDSCQVATPTGSTSAPDGQGVSTLLCKSSSIVKWKLEDHLYSAVSWFISRCWVCVWGGAWGGACVRACARTCTWVCARREYVYTFLKKKKKKKFSF